jgi:hypothetical protein
MTAAEFKKKWSRYRGSIVFCLFAEDTGLLPEDLFTDIL